MPDGSVLSPGDQVGSPAAEWPRRISGPKIDLTNVTIVAASNARLRNGFGGADTAQPAVCSCAITPFQHEASALAPCTKMMAGFVRSD
jgi:hypothetical protein